MRIFKIKTQTSVESILNEFGELYEYESHNIFNSVFTPFNSSRVGIHAYLKEDRVSGYYENGKLTHTKTDLLKSKTWFYLKFKRESNQTIVKGLIVGDPYLIGGLWFGITMALIDCLNGFNVGTALVFAFIAYIAVNFLESVFNEHDLLYKDINAVIKRAELSNTGRQGDGSPISSPSEKTDDGSVC